MSLPAITWAWSLEIENPTQKLVLMALCDHVDPEGTCWPSVSLIAERAGCKRRTVQRHLRELEKQGLIESVPHYRPDGSQTSNRYRVRMTWGGDNMTRGGVTGDTGGVSLVTPHEPSVESSVKKQHTSPKRKTPDYPPEFEEVWAVHPRGPKKEALPEYESAVPDRIPHDRLLKALTSYVRSEVRDDFKGVHLHRWIRDDRWDEQFTEPSVNVGSPQDDWMANL
jgi:DNA-binding transcriptional ArsR family regulator